MDLPEININDFVSALRKSKSKKTMTSVVINGHRIKDLRPFNSRLWFEYHCQESHDSSDATIWYRSHQQVQILGVADCDPPVMTTRKERIESGHPLLYKVRFEDGLEWDVFEDELLDSPEEFERPNPPHKRRKQ